MLTIGAKSFAAGITALLLCAATLDAAAAVKRRDTERWFDRDGQATAYGRRVAKEQGLPPLAGGVWVEMVKAASTQLVDKIHVTRTAPCATVQFKIARDGKTDQLLVLESQPHPAYGERVVQSVAHWQFQPSEQAQWRTIVVDFEESEQLTGSRIAREVSCRAAETQIVDALSPGRELRDSRPPHFPPAAVEARAPGCVTVRFTVRGDGLADGYEIVDAQPDDRFVAASAAALNDWRFSESSVESRAAARFAFVLDDEVQAPACQWPFEAASAN